MTGVSICICLNAHVGTLSTSRNVRSILESDSIKTILDFYFFKLDTLLIIFDPFLSKKDWYKFCKEHLTERGIFNGSSTGMDYIARLMAFCGSVC